MDKDFQQIWLSLQVAGLQATASDQLALQRRQEDREESQRSLEEKIYQGQKMVDDFTNPNDTTSAVTMALKIRHYLLVTAAGVGTEDIRGIENKKAFDSVTSRAYSMFQRLLLDSSVRRAVEAAKQREAEALEREAAERWKRKREEAERRKRAWVIALTTIAVFIISVSGAALWSEHLNQEAKAQARQQAEDSKREAEAQAREAVELRKRKAEAQAREEAERRKREAEVQAREEAERRKREAEAQAREKEDRRKRESEARAALADAEKRAALQLGEAQNMLVDAKTRADGIERMRKVVREFPGTESARTALRLLNEIEAEALAREEEDRRKREAETERKAKLAKDEVKAAPFLRYAKKLLDTNKPETAKERLREIIKDYPDTEAAKESRLLLDALSK